MRRNTICPVGPRSYQDFGGRQKVIGRLCLQTECCGPIAWVARICRSICRIGTGHWALRCPPPSASQAFCMGGRPIIKEGGCESWDCLGGSTRRSARKPLRGSWSLIGESYFEKIFTRQHEAEHQQEQV